MDRNAIGVMVCQLKLLSSDHKWEVKREKNEYLVMDMSKIELD